MRVTVVRFSRPVILRTEECGDDIPFYQTVYGFVIPESQEPINMKYLNDYVGYLAGMSCWANGDTFFTVKYVRDVPDWCDKKGRVHFHQDSWMDSIEKKCVQKLNLSYETIKMEVEEKDLENYTIEKGLIADERFYYDLKRYASKPLDVPKYEPLF